MDEQRPLWRTAWFWKQVCLCYLLPLTVLLTIFAILNKTNHLSDHALHVIDRWLTWFLFPVTNVAFQLWINNRAKQRTNAQQPLRNA